jgi:Zn finger protein HypA/HybF involved in hydrogenase expression
MKNEEEIRQFVKESFSYAQVLKKLGLKPIGGNYRILKNKIFSLGLDTSHFTGKAHLKGKTHDWNNTKIPLEEILTENSSYQTYKLKIRLLKENLIENCCDECGIKNEWNGKELSLHLDHINGINTDNRIENLRLLCPNCHSQTDTYAGKNKKIK